MIMRDNEGRGTGDKGEDEDEGDNGNNDEDKGETRATTLYGTQNKAGLDKMGAEA